MATTMSVVVVNGVYALEEELAQGEAATTWAGRRLEDGRAVVLKAYRRPAAALAVAEARRIRAVRHPAVVAVLDVDIVGSREPDGPDGPASGAPFVVTDRIPGADLETFLAPATSGTGRRRAAAATEILAQALAALAHLHRRGIVHRDLHPGNLRVSERSGVPVVTLLDFDLAVPLGSAAPAAGRLAFIPPEQFLGRPEARSDLWALAASVRWSLVRADPLQGHSALPTDVAAWAPALLRSEPVPLSRAFPEAPENLARTIDACLSRDPARRPASARAALALLDPARAEQAEAPDPLAFDPPFVGRRVELERLAGALSPAAPGGAESPAIVVVEGPEASGRRRLIAEALQRLAEQAVLAGRPGPRVERLRVAEPVAATVRLRDLLDKLPAGGIAVVDATETGDRTAAFLGEASAVVRAARCLAPAPAGGGRASPAVVVAAGPGADSDGVLRLPLERLSAAEAAALLGHVLVEPPAPPVVRALLEASDGWPGLLLAEAAARFPDGRPATGAAPGRRPAAASPEALDETARRMLRRLAVEVLPVPEDQLADDGASPPDDAALRTLPRLQRLGWVRRSADGYEVVAERRETALRFLGAAERRRLHSSLARAAARDAAAALRRSFHRLAVAGTAELRAVAKAEADDARTRGEDARVSVLAWTLERDREALDGEALLGLARAAMELGRYENARSALEEARRRGLPERPGRRKGAASGPGWAEWAWLRAAWLRRTGELAEAEQLLRGVVREGTGEAAAASRLDLADVALGRGDVRAAQEALDGLDAVPGRLAERSVELRARLALARGDVGEAETVLDGAPTRSEGPVGAAPAVGHRLRLLRGIARLHRGDVLGAAEAYATAFEDARRAGDRHDAATCAANLGAAMLEAGRAVEAVQQLRGAALDLTALGARRELPAVLLNLANAQVRAGDVDGAWRALEHVRAVTTAEVWSGLEAWALALRADAARLRGEGVAAAGHLRAALERPETRADESLAQSLRVDLGDVLAQAGDPTEARAVLAGLPAQLATALLEAKRQAALLRASLAAAETPEAGALQRLARALDAVPAPHDRALEWRAWLVLASAARRAGRGDVALRAAGVVRTWREEVRAMGFDPLGSDPDRKTLEELLAEPGAAVALRPAEAETGAMRERELRRWLTIQRRLVSERHPARLLDLILETLIEIAGAERGMLLTHRKGTGGLVVRRVRNLSSGALGGVEGGSISLSIAEEVARTGEPVVTMDARQDGRFLASRSVHDLGLRSVMVLPLMARGRTIGVAYLDHRLRESAFEPASVEVALDFAGQAALVLETARHLRLLRRRRQEIERLNVELQRRVEEQATELRGLKETIDSTMPPEVADPFPGFVGRAPAMRDLFRRMKRVAETDLPVLILGDSGTGKELVARALFTRGRRREAPFVTENCAAIPESLLESILFGHVRGAFTGADRDHAGLFVVADRGTLFLDEIGEMSLGLQSKLLRVLEDGEIRAVGGTTVRRVDVRILAASNRDLEAMVREGKFREDLYYRLAVLTVRLPSLRERTEDVPLLVAHFLAKHAPGRKVRVAPEAMRRLARHAWPGNVRQLENTIVRSLVLAGGDLLDEDCVDFGTALRPAGPQAVPGAAAAGLDLKANVDVLERGLIERALAEAGGNRTRAAALLGLSRYGLLKKLQRGVREAASGSRASSRAPAGSPRK